MLKFYLSFWLVGWCVQFFLVLLLLLLFFLLLLHALLLSFFCPFWWFSHFKCSHFMLCVENLYINMYIYSLGLYVMPLAFLIRRFASYLAALLCDVWRWRQQKNVICADSPFVFRSFRMGCVCDFHPHFLSISCMLSPVVWWVRSYFCVKSSFFLDMFAIEQTSTEMNQRIFKCVLNWNRELD